MANDKTLFEVIENERKAVKKYKPELLEMTEFITKNLKYDFFEWQKSALENFLIFDRTSELDDFPDLKNKPTHLLFNMATGAGKTMMMAALILYYFEKDTTLIDNRIFTIHFQLIEFQYLKIH